MRSPEKAKALQDEGVEGFTFDARTGELGTAASALHEADALLISIPPAGENDPLPENAFATDRRGGPSWLDWLSFHDRRLWRPSGRLGKRDDTLPAFFGAQPRALAAEASWSRLGSQARIPVVSFRLPGIYGPGRNALMALREGTARRIVKPGQVFNRVHVEDIATALTLSLTNDVASAVYNVTDDEPTPLQDVISFAAGLLGIEPPPLIDFAKAELSPMAASLYAESKRVRNDLIKRRLGFTSLPDLSPGLTRPLATGPGKAQISSMKTRRSGRCNRLRAMEA